MRKSRSEYNKTYRDRKLLIDPDYRRKENKRYIESRKLREPGWGPKIYRRIQTKKLRLRIFEKLGNRCVNPCCAWVNEDGTRGCLDTRCLQIDHKNGGGKKELKEMCRRDYYRKVIADTTDSYQILCANCNWIKRFLNREL